ncbi:low molecular weight protein-tyrosine-phosphatase [Pedobacter sp. SL55]|uniref:low molecular weight protein-tyrosine-phosphatase n=1 Tax=Pedobacter sp. SL55 TaxID=2995161 RepID=UPI00226DF82D|nr:low molecular weight protein-tyrosine-phosphatase [Pedobacter sp. SL55]WAC41692.1 low molecular weight phosphotyrosine protein phosphatase [Pedobacter sp. SL55]
MKILMVCLGNICRSPLAHGILQHLANQENLGWTVHSAGTGDWHVGNPPDRRSVLAARNLGYDISTQRARHFSTSFFEEYDHILVMDKNNLKDVLQLAETQEHQQKVKLFLVDGEVTDPYYDNELFKPVSLQVEQRCKEIIAELRK